MNHNLLPTDQYKVVSKAVLQDFHFETVSQLYQPFIGATSTSLFLNLSSQLGVGDYNQLTNNLIEDLLITLDINIDDLRESLKKLEAVNLIHTYVNRNDQKIILFELLIPKNGQEFFRDSLLSSMLLQYVGQQRFAFLLDKFEGNHWQVQSFEEVSADFVDAFQLPDHQNKVQVNAKQNEKNIKLPSKVNWQLMKQMIQNSFVPGEELVQHTEIINTIAVMYGLDEVQLLRLMENAMDVARNKVNWNRFRSLAVENYEFSLKPDESKQVHTQTKDDSQNNSQSDLITAFENYSPMEFLIALKEEQGIEAISNEERITISNAVSNDNLPPAVINVLIHYMLVDQEMSSLNRKYFERTALDWMKHKIDTPQKAIEYTKKWQYERRKKSTSQGKYNRKIGRKPIIEKMPYWVNQKQTKTQQSQKKQSGNPEVKEQIQDLLNKINHD